MAKSASSAIAPAGARPTWLRAVSTSTPRSTATAVGWSTPEDLTPARPISPVDRTPDLRCPLLGIFGAEDSNPSPEQTALIEQALRANHKTYEFHTIDNAGHAFFSVDRPHYRVDAAKEGWKLIWDFFGRYLKNA